MPRELKSGLHFSIYKICYFRITIRHICFRIPPSSNCGPFRNLNQNYTSPSDIVTTKLNGMKDLEVPLRIILSPGFVVGVLVVLGLVLLTDVSPSRFITSLVLLLLSI